MFVYTYSQHKIKVVFHREIQYFSYKHSAKTDKTISVPKVNQNENTLIALESNLIDYRLTYKIVTR